MTMVSLCLFIFDMLYSAFHSPHLPVSFQSSIKSMQAELSEPNNTIRNMTPAPKLTNHNTWCQCWTLTSSKVKLVLQRREHARSRNTANPGRNLSSVTSIYSTSPLTSCSLPPIASSPSMFKHFTLFSYEMELSETSNLYKVTLEATNTTSV